MSVCVFVSVFVCVCVCVCVSVSIGDFICMCKRMLAFNFFWVCVSIIHLCERVGIVIISVCACMSARVCMCVFVSVCTKQQ